MVALKKGSERFDDALGIKDGDDVEETESEELENEEIEELDEDSDEGGPEKKEEDY